jgi:dTDP-4-amino-4,6-dideoxygalactose transaminase
LVIGTWGFVCATSPLILSTITGFDSWMRVPLLDLNAQNRALESELKAAFERVLHSGQFILGPEVEVFENRIAELTAVRHAIGVSSGTDAILLALMALGIGPGDEVLCPTFTFFATAGCVARVGARPVFVDSCPVCFNINAADAAAKVTAKTRAIIPVHLFGQSADLDGVMALARQHKLAVIEDAAQALGAGYKGRKVGGLGTCGALSFFPTKNLGGFGDSGMLVTQDPDFAEKSRMLRTHGARPKYYHKLIGGNFRLDPLQAALLAVKLPHYPVYTGKRRANAAAYTEKLSKLPNVMIANATDCCSSRSQASGSEFGIPRSALDTGEGKSAIRNPQSAIVLPATAPQREHIWNQYTIRVVGPGRRDALKAHLASRGIGTEIYYPVPMHQQECFAHLRADETRLPMAETLSSQCLSLPIYPELSAESCDQVIQAIEEFLGS